jgi:hypothetical protein
MTIRDVARRLPGILQLRDCSQALAMLDAILCPERWLRYHSFDTHWGPDQLVTALNCHRTPAELAEELDSIGYPTAARR